MTVESVTYISDLNASYPAAGDNLTEGDDHIRNLKTGIKTTFPNVSGAVTPTHTELNYVDGVTSAIQTQLDAKAASAAGGLVLLATQTASASSTIDFTSSIDGTYEEYEIHLVEFLVGSNNTGIYIRTTVDGSTWPSSAGDYGWLYSYDQATTNTVANGSTTSTEIRLMPQSGSDSPTNDSSSGGISGVIKFYNPAGTTHKKRVQWDLAYTNTATDSGFVLVHGAGQRDATVAITGIRIAPASGTITSGKAKLYGVRKSN